MQKLYIVIARVFPDVPTDNHLLSLSVLRVSESQIQSEARHQGAGFIKKHTITIYLLFNVHSETVDPTSERFFPPSTLELTGEWKSRSSEFVR